MVNNIINSSVSFGNLNAILHFHLCSNEQYERIYEDIIHLFSPNDVVHSLFDLKEMKMKEYAEVERILENSFIKKTIFSKDKEKIILESYKDHTIIEHICDTDKFHEITGYLLIEKYYKEELNHDLIIGYELSIDVDSYENSLQENISDSSLFPIIISKRREGNCSLQEYIFEDEGISLIKIKMMRKYLCLVWSC